MWFRDTIHIGFSRRVIKLLELLGEDGGKKISAKNLGHHNGKNDDDGMNSVRYRTRKGWRDAKIMASDTKVLKMSSY